MNTDYHKNKKTTTEERDPLHNLEQELRIRGFSPRTIESYLLYNRLFLQFSGKSPKAIINDDIRQYLISLKEIIY